MKRTHLVIGVIGIAITLAAEPVCHVIQTAIKHHYSQKTLDGWAVWRGNNPSWIPKTKKETLAALNIACAPIPTLDVETTELIAPLDQNTPIDFVLDEQNPSEILPAISSVPEEISETKYPSALYTYQPPYLFTVGLPLVSLPIKKCKKCKTPPPPVAILVPEPWPLGLVLLGASCLYFKTFRKDEAK